MKLKFDANQSYQQEAIQSIMSVFEGQPKNEGAFDYNLNEPGSLNLIAGVANRLALSEDQILKNVQAVQNLQGLTPSSTLKGMHFSVEMETGTGKTYVYLRTIYELNKTYGFKKFVIVVPSVAIREGVLKNLQITHDHFQTLYDRTPVNFTVYDSAKVSQLRGFATGNIIEILILNIDSFTKDENIINRSNDRLTGQRPIEFIQATQPIVIIDEPQNMETDKRREALNNLNPLCTLRYSATHKNTHNLVYSLNPVKAYNLGLVKQIEVDSIITQNSSFGALVRVESIQAAKTRISAKVTIEINLPEGVRSKTVTIKAGDDLYVISKERDVYRQGYIVEEIDAENKCLTFSNGTILNVGQNQGGYTDEIMKFQIKKTIEEHLKKEKWLRPKGIKVLSLFFIDKVANYRQYDVNGNATKGKLAQWFEEIYGDLAQGKESTLVHNGYFSQDKKGSFKDTSGETIADNDTYKLIMQDKERLLSLDTPLQFIFTHSALREGWDNPNVFQICTLNESKSELKKRQEIGRGLRLSVNQDGERIFDKSINRLTVIANEPYDDFAKALQNELKEAGYLEKINIKNAHHTKLVKYRKGFELDERFKDIWNRINYQTTYRVHYDTPTLIEEAARKIRDLPAIPSPKVRSSRTQVQISTSGLSGDLLSEKSVALDTSQLNIPDVLGYLQEKTELTRSTLLQILTQSNKVKDILINPQQFLDLCSNAINTELKRVMIEGIRYLKIGDSKYEMRLFDDAVLLACLEGYVYEVQNQTKTIYENYIPLDSTVETTFAKDCETSEQVEFYFKLPRWFKISTPIGEYSPDWALIFKDEQRIYFVAETKDTLNLDKLRTEEQLKIKCGLKHFEAGDKVSYRHVTKVGDLI